MNNAPRLNEKDGVHTHAVSVTLDGLGTSAGVVTRSMLDKGTLS